VSTTVSESDLRSARNWDLHACLPDTLPAAQIRAFYRADSASGQRRYEWNGWVFDVPPGVFLPSATSRLVHEWLLDGRISVAGADYAAMGVGLGVEAVTAGARGARAVYALDVHEPSVKATVAHYSRIVDHRGPPLVALVSDLWREMPEGVQVDVVTFNTPFATVSVSDDPDVSRNRSAGFSLAQRFFRELKGRGLLAPGGTAYLALSNVEPLRDVVGLALRMGFDAEALHVEHHADGRLQTYLLAFREAR
jgi:release factor glutamine methyltransferase